MSKNEAFHLKCDCGYEEYHFIDAHELENSIKKSWFLILGRM